MVELCYAGILQMAGFRGPIICHSAALGKPPRAQASLGNNPMTTDHEATTDRERLAGAKVLVVTGSCWPMIRLNLLHNNGSWPNNKIE